MKSSCLRAVAFTALLIAGHVSAATFLVTTTAPSGPGSLQQAIIDANANPGQDTIAFGIGPDDGMVKTITVTNLLPIISGPTIIDGYTQSGSGSNTLATGNNAVLLIEVTATNSVRGCFDITGAGSTVRGLIINGFYDSGFQVGNMITLEAAASNCVVEGNFIGTDKTGTNASPLITFIGVKVFSPGNRIGGTSPGARNVIAGCVNDGINLAGAAGTNNTVQGNYLGTDKTGTKAIANSVGVDVDSSFNLIGGTLTGAGNLLSGNSSAGLTITSGSTNVVEGNLIGLAISGTNALPNGAHGMTISSSRGNRVGNTTAAARNVISGNVGNGINISGATTNFVFGNFIGTDITGSNAVPNAANGVHMDLCVGAFIGGAAPGAGNVIAGNAGKGVSFTRGSVLHVDGNFIGTDLTGTLDLGNVTHGIDGNSAVSKIDIGVEAANTIAFNGSGLGHAGITLNNGAISNNIIGNLIFTNAGPGVFVTLSASRTRISDNSIFDNGNLGIYENNTGFPTVNDPCDADGGNNDQQNYPVITAANSTVDSVTIAGFLPSTASTAFDLEFFANTICDPSGFGEGEMFLGSTNVTTGANCTNNFNVTFPVGVAGGLIITATATDPNGNTSEFSKCFTNQGAAVMVTCSLTPPLATNNVSTAHTVTATVTTNSNPASGAIVDFNVIAGPNTGTSGVRTTSVSGTASFTYSGSATPDTDTIRGIATVAGGTATGSATKVWIATPNQPPVAICQSVTTNANASCQASLVATNFDGGSFDMDGTITTRAINPAGPFTKGVQQVVLTVTDNNGAMSSCTTTVTVVDNTMPMISCRATIISNVAEGVTSSVVHFGAPTAIDNCPMFTTNCVPASGSVFDLGTTTVTCTAIDMAGNTNTCNFKVIVKETTPASADLGVIKVDLADPVEVGHDFSYRVTVANNGPDPATGVVMVDTLPPSLSFVSANPSQGTCTNVNGILTCDLGAIANANTVIVTVQVTANAIGEPQNTATVSGNEPDPNLNNNTATETTTVNAGVHDFAVINLKAPKNINLKAASPALTKRVKVQIQNRSPHNEVITDLTGLVSVTLSNLQVSGGCAPEARLIDGPPNNPKTLKPKQKMNIFFNVTFDPNGCVPDPMKGPGHEDFSYRAHVNHATLDGLADTHPADDDCPRAALPGGVDPNPDGKIKDKGCASGADVKTDVFLKQ